MHSMEVKIGKLQETVEKRLVGEQLDAIESVFKSHQIIIHVQNETAATSETQDGNIGIPVKLIPVNKLGDALGEIQHRKLSESAVDEIFRRTAADYSDQGMTLREFSLACKFPSKIEEWFATLELPRLLSHCIPHDSEEVLNDELDALRNLDEDALTAAATVFAEQVFFFRDVCA
jgi:hypothetical protein